MQCPKYGRLQKEMGRAYTDIDFAGYKSQSTKVAKFLLGLGYKEDLEVNTFFGGERLIFNHPTNGLHVDVFFDRLNFCHEVNWVGRLEAENWTLPLAEMLMEKMQIVRLNEKDLIDTIMLLLEHPLGDSDQETIHIDRVSKLCARDWGLWRTLTMNLEKVGRLGQEYTSLSGDEKEKLAAQAALEKAHTEILHLTAANSHIAQERDEARKWARFYQALAQSWKKAYENTWKNNRVIPK